MTPLQKWLILLILIALNLLVWRPAGACEGDQGHGYISLGIGKAGTWMTDDPQEQDKWEDDGGNHALVRVGYRYPIFENWLWINPELGHHSTFDKQPPEPELDYFVINIEARLIP